MNEETFQQMKNPSYEEMLQSIRFDIQTLARIYHPYMKDMMCHQLWNRVNQLEEIIERRPHNNVIEKEFSLNELALYDGKNGMSAYVAVDGNVYDVTNDAAWAAASHFGLKAGRDLTSEFSSCHAGQQYILSNLQQVGRMK